MAVVSGHVCVWVLVLSCREGVPGGGITRVLVREEAARRINSGRKFSRTNKYRGAEHKTTGATPTRVASPDSRAQQGASIPCAEPAGGGRPIIYDGVEPVDYQHYHHSRAALTGHNSGRTSPTWTYGAFSPERKARRDKQCRAPLVQPLRARPATPGPRGPLLGVLGVVWRGVGPAADPCGPARAGYVCLCVCVCC